MRSLPVMGRVYLIAIYAAGLIVLFTPIYYFPANHAQVWELGLFFVLAALAGGKKVRLMRNKGTEDVGSFSIGFTITYAAMLRFGLIGGILVGAISCLACCLFPKRQPLYQLLFNLALTLIDSLAMGSVFLALNGHTLALRLLESFPAIAASCLTCFALNTLAVAAIVGLCTGQKILEIWTTKFLWTAPGYFVGALISSLSCLLLGRHIGAILLFGAPMVYLTYRSFALYFVQKQEQEQHIEELESSHAQLTDRCLMESRLAHERKMQSIGHLAAGIAHEINTPTQFIGDNARFLQDAFTDLLALQDKYEALLCAYKAGRVDPSLAAEVEAAIEETDIQYLIEEIPKALKQSLDGIGRVAKIVQAMKEFSHPGAEAKVAIDLNRAIESTLTISRNEWKYVADLVTELDPTLPPVPCLPGEFNQVLLNVLINAAHAIADVVGDSPEQKGVITITTRREGEEVEIRVKDTGTGIPEAIHSKVFDPFFTTKTVGKGTGQGLSIAYTTIVDKHGGSIHFETEEGVGTTFIIRLPLKQT